MIGLQIFRNLQQLAKRTKEVLQTSLQVLSVMATTHFPLRPTQFIQRSSPKLRRLRTTEFLITCIGLLAILGCESKENADLEAQQRDLDQAFAISGALYKPPTDVSHPYHYDCGGFTVDNPIVAAALTELNAIAPVAFLILCNQSAKEPFVPSPEHYCRLFDLRDQIPDRYKNHYKKGQVLNDYLAHFGITFAETPSPTISCNQKDVAILKRLLKKFKEAIPDIMVPDVTARDLRPAFAYHGVGGTLWDNTKGKSVNFRLPYSTSHILEVAACFDPSPAGRFLLRTILQQDLSKVQDLQSFTEYYVPDHPGIQQFYVKRYYQAKALFESLAPKQSQTTNSDSNQNPLNQNIFVDLFGNIVAPKPMHQEIRDFLGFDGASRGVYSLSHDINPELLSRDYPHFIMSFPLETNDDNAVYDSWGILENTAASFMTYCLVKCKSNNQIDPREFERLCTEAEAMLQQDQTEFFPNFEHRAIRNRILKPYGMRDAQTELGFGSLLVCAKHFRSVRDSVVSGLGETEAEKVFLREILIEEKPIPRQLFEFGSLNRLEGDQR